jgi:hypothetical protein
LIDKRADGFNEPSAKGDKRAPEDADADDECGIVVHLRVSSITQSPSGKVMVDLILTPFLSGTHTHAFFTGAASWTGEPAGT